MNISTTLLELYTKSIDRSLSSEERNDFRTQLNIKKTEEAKSILENNITDVNLIRYSYSTCSVEPVTLKKGVLGEEGNAAVVILSNGKEATFQMTQICRKY